MYAPASSPRVALKSASREKPVSNVPPLRLQAKRFVAPSGR
jgi:hypothetical protein